MTMMNLMMMMMMTTSMMMMALMMRIAVDDDFEDAGNPLRRIFRRGDVVASLTIALLIEVRNVILSRYK